jgi:DNA-binding CsgD family transcriptional regulator
MPRPVAMTERDLRALLGIVSDHRDDLPAQGLPLSLLSELAEQIPCDCVCLLALDSTQRVAPFEQEYPGHDAAEVDDADALFWHHYWDCEPCSYPDRSGDLRSVTMISDFYPARQWHNTGMYRDYFRPSGLEHEMMLCLPDRSIPSAAPGRSIRLIFFRGPGSGFSERDRTLLALLRPHLHELYLDVQHRQRGGHQLTPRHRELMRLVAAGHTNAQIGNRLGISEGTVRKHLENIYERLQVSSRTAAVRLVLPEQPLPDAMQPAAPRLAPVSQL